MQDCRRLILLVKPDPRCAATTTLAAALIALSSTHARCELLPIVNPGFEELNVTLRPGEQTNGAGGTTGGGPITPVTTRWQFPFNPGDNQPQSGVLVPGWRTQNPGIGSLAAVLNPGVTFGDRPWMTGYSGNYVGAAQAAFMSQTLDARIQPSTRYTLSFKAGIGITDSEYAPLIQLVVSPDLTTFARPDSPGVALLARGDLLSIPREQFGVMMPRSFSYTSPAVLPTELAGKYLAITFLGSDGIPRMVYDDFQLEAVAVPVPTTGALFGIAAIAGVCRPRRHPRPGSPDGGACSPIKVE